MRPSGWLSSLGARLLLSYILVCAVGVVVLFVTVRLTAPSFFDRHLGNMQGVQHAGGQMMRGAASAAQLDEAMSDSLNRGLLIAAGAALGVGLVVSLVLSRQITGRVQRLSAASARIAGGDYAERVETGGARELAQLAASFNAMAASLEDTERRRRELIGDVAHELRTPVTVLRGYIEGLGDGVFPPTAETWARLEAETGRLERLVEQLSELSRAESGTLRLDIRPIGALQALDAVAARFRPQLQEKGLALVVEEPAQCPDVLADGDRLAQVLDNLVANAMHYTPAPGTVTLQLRAAGGTVTFAVIDTGVGLAPEDLERVFERFYRVDRSRARASGGSGVGLTIARALVKAMGGTLTAESPGAGSGSTFTLTLPAAGPRS